MKPSLSLVRPLPVVPSAGIGPGCADPVTSQERLQTFPTAMNLLLFQNVYLLQPKLWSPHHLSIHLELNGSSSHVPSSPGTWLIWRKGQNVSCILSFLFHNGFDLQVRSGSPVWRVNSGLKFSVNLHKAWQR